MLKHCIISEEKIKDRFTDQGCDERDKPFLMYNTAILKPLSIKIILSAAGHHKFRNFSHYIAQLYLESRKKLK